MSTLTRLEQKSPAPVSHRRVDAAGRPGGADRSGRVGPLAVVAPLLLVAGGILGWFYSLTQRAALPTTSAKSSLDYAAGSLGVAAVAVLLAGTLTFGWLAVEALRRPGRPGVVVR